MIIQYQELKNGKELQILYTDKRRCALLDTNCQVCNKDSFLRTLIVLVTPIRNRRKTGNGRASKERIRGTTNKNSRRRIFMRMSKCHASAEPPKITRRDCWSM